MYEYPFFSQYLDFSHGFFESRKYLQGSYYLLPPVCPTSTYLWEGTEGGKEVKYLYALL